MEYIKIGKYQQDDKVEVITPSNETKTGRVFRITPQKGNYCILSVLPDDKEEIITVQYENKISKID